MALMSPQGKGNSNLSGGQTLGSRIRRLKLAGLTFDCRGFNGANQERETASHRSYTELL